MTNRLLVISIDTEIDKCADWRIATPCSFKSITEGIPNILSPLFDRYGAIPTYLLSPEVIENDEACDVLSDLGIRAELGTHLHPQFIEPERDLWPDNMDGKNANNIQSQYSREVEARKLQLLTENFKRRFGKSPTSFRAGRYGLSNHSFELLAGLGYIVDSSVTPGLIWKYAEGKLDYRKWSNDPQIIKTNAGSIVELPLSILPNSRISPYLQLLPNLIQRTAVKALGKRATFQWLRPSWAKPRDLINYLEYSTEQVLVLMFHSMEIITGASPYSVHIEDVKRIISILEELLEYCAKENINAVGMTDAATKSCNI